MLMARSYNALGILHTHLVPIQNNPPVGLDPDVYLHWPPLYPIVLAGFVRLFGDTPAAGRILALLIILATTAVVMLIARHLFSSLAAVFAGFFYLTCRATYLGASAILHQPLAMLFGTTSVWFYLLAVESRPRSQQRASSRLYALLGTGSVVLTMLTAWDPVFISFGLLAAAIYLRNRAGVRLAIAYISAAILTFAAVQADYLLSYPALFKNQFSTIAYRAGMAFNSESSAGLHTIVDSVHYETQMHLHEVVSHTAYFIYTFIGPMLLLSAALVFALWSQAGRDRQNDTQRSALLLLAAFGLPWIVWYLAMRNYVSIHPFVLVMATPFVAIAGSLVLDHIVIVLAAQPAQRGILIAVLTALPAGVAYPLLDSIRTAHIQFDTVLFSDFIPLIERSTPANAVVLTPIRSLVPTYYSHRHLVRGIESDEWLARASSQARQSFPGSPLFLALQNPDRKDFPESLPHLPVVASEGDSTVYRLSDR